MKKKTPASAVRVILVSAPANEAENIARTLLEERLIACANIIPGVTSLYWWKGELVRDGEMLIVMKSRQSRLKALLKRLKEVHAYSVPEFLALPVREGNPDYVRWLSHETNPRLLNV